MSDTCPRCGSRDRSFDEYSGQTICAVCGYRFQTEEQRQEELHYHENLFRAKEYLRVADWDRAFALVSPYIDSRPVDKMPLLIGLCAKTCGYTDIALKDETRRMTVSLLWKKLKRLGCINEMMANYSEQRRGYLSGQIKRAMHWAFLVVLGTCLLIITVHIVAISISTLLIGLATWRIIAAKPVSAWLHIRESNDDSFG